MRRREFIGLVGGMAAWPIWARGQEPNRVRRLGYFTPAVGPNDVDEEFVNALQQLGWVQDRNIKIAFRSSGGRQDNEKPIVEELVGLGQDLFVAWGPQLAVEFVREAPQTPVVFLISHDPTDFGLVSNWARPGGNVTGVTTLASTQIVAKRLEFLQAAVPSLARVVVLFSTERNRGSQSRDSLTAAAKAFRIELDEIEVTIPQDLEAAMRGAKDRGAQAVYLWPSGFVFSFPKEISDAANANGLPSVHPFREGAFAGGLIAYAADLREVARRGAAYADQILRGTPPGSLPVEQMSKFDLFINLKTAKALGLTIPPTLLIRADEVIE